MKSRIFRKLLSYWPVYLASAITLTAGSAVLLHVVADPSEKETFTMFFASVNPNEKNIKNRLKEFVPDSIRKFNIRTVPVSVSNYSAYYHSYGILASDILVLPESKVTSVSSFAALDDNVVSKYVAGCTYYTDSEVNYGVLVYDSSTDTGPMKDDIVYYGENFPKENYYAFFNINSVHLGDLSSSKTDTALIMLEALLNYGKNQS